MISENHLEDGHISPVHFATAFWGFQWGSGDNRSMHPVQMFILKALYGVPLNSTDKRITVGCPLFGDELMSLTEAEYLSYLLDSGRISTKDLDGNFQGMVLVGGARGGKTGILATIIGYEIFRLLQSDSPSKKLGLTDKDKITFGVVGVAGAPSYDSLAGKIERSPYFRSLLQSCSSKVTTLKSTKDLREGAKGDFSVQVSKLSTVPNGAVHSLLLDDVSFLPRKKASLLRDSFKGVENPLAGKGKLIIASEADKEGSFLWGEWLTADLPGNEGRMLALRIPSWELNPDIPVAFLHAQYVKLGAKEFATRFNADFAVNREV